MAGERQGPLNFLESGEVYISEVMGTQLKAVALLIAVLMIADGLMFGGRYRVETVHGISAFLSDFGARWGVGHGRDWSAPPRPKHD
jgi:hypothetical protein